MLYRMLISYQQPHITLSFVTQTHSLHASERVWWTPTSSLVQPISRIWGALILHWLVVNSYTRGDCRHNVTKPPSSPFRIKFQFLQIPSNALLISSAGCSQHQKVAERTSQVHHAWNHVQQCSNRHPLCSYSPTISQINAPQILGIARLNKTGRGCSPDLFWCMWGMGLGRPRSGWRDYIAL